MTTMIDRRGAAAFAEEMRELLETMDVSTFQPKMENPPYSWANMLPEDMRKQPGWKTIGTVATEWLDGWAAKNDTLRMARLPVTEDAHRIMLARMGHPFETDMTPYAMGIAKLPDQIAAWSSVAGTSRWVRFVGFLLGTAVRVKPLYTRDYRTFFPQPLGTKVMHGGEWYKTTHVDVEINLRSLRVNTRPRAGQSLEARVLEVVTRYKPVQLRLRKLIIRNELDMDFGRPTAQLGVGVRVTLKKLSPWGAAGAL